MRPRNFSIHPKLAAALGAAICLALPALASAQQPSYAQPPAPAYGRQDSVKGTLSGFDGQWIVYMHDERGYTDHITLHQGTIINPTGIKLLEGMQVTIYGYADGPTFQANRVDVAYSPYSPYYGANGNPAPADYGWSSSPYYGYGGYGYGYPYGYGGSYVGIGINWGWGWGWGWPGYWGYPGYWGGGCCGYYGGGYYGRYPYYPYRGGGYYYRGQVGAPVRGGYPVRGGMPGGGRAPISGGGHAPVSGAAHGGGGGRPR